MCWILCCRLEGCQAELNVATFIPPLSCPLTDSIWPYYLSAEVLLLLDPAQQNHSRSPAQCSPPHPSVSPLLHTPRGLLPWRRLEPTLPPQAFMDKPGLFPLSPSLQSLSLVSGLRPSIFFSQGPGLSLCSFLECFVLVQISRDQMCGTETPQRTAFSRASRSSGLRVQGEAVRVLRCGRESTRLHQESWVLTPPANHHSPVCFLFRKMRIIKACVNDREHSVLVNDRALCKCRWRLIELSGEGGCSCLRKASALKGEERVYSHPFLPLIHIFMVAKALFSIHRWCSLIFLS